MRHIYYLFFFLLAACSTATEPPSSTPTLQRGSTLTYHRVYTDLDMTPTAESDSVVYRVYAADTVVVGANHATIVQSADDTTTYRVNSSGEIQIFAPAITILPNFTIPEAWLTLPTNGDTTVRTQLSMDSVTSVQGFPGRIMVSRTVAGRADSSIVLSGKSLKIQRAVVTVRVAVTVMDVVVLTEVAMEYGYAPEKNCFAWRKTRTYSNSPQSPVQNGGEILTLTSVTY